LAFNGDGTRLYVPRIHYIENFDESGTLTDYQLHGDVVVIDTDPTSPTYNTVVDLDPSTSELDTIPIETGQSPGFVTANGKRLYLATYDYKMWADSQTQGTGEVPDSTVLVIDIDPNSPTYNQVIDVDPTTTETDGLPVGNLPFNSAVSPDGSVAYVVNVLDGTVTIIDTATNEQLGEPFVYDLTPQTMTGGTVYVNILAISPDGKRMYISKNQDDTVTAISVA